MTIRKFKKSGGGGRLTGHQLKQTIKKKKNVITESKQIHVRWWQDRFSRIRPFVSRYLERMVITAPANRIAGWLDREFRICTVC